MPVKYMSQLKKIIKITFYYTTDSSIMFHKVGTL